MSSNGMNGLPGMSAMGDTLEFVKNLWGSMKIPGMSVPSLSPEDIDKQISDLKAVESWLQVNMNMLRGSIQALEVQSATLAALRSMSESFTKAAQPEAEAMGEPAFESPFTGGKAAEQETPGSAGAPDMASVAAQFANPAVWWDAVQQQFSTAVGQALTPEPKKPRKPAAKKPAAKKSPSKKAASPRKRAPKA